MKIKIFLSDSGWGPLVRQSAIVFELQKVFPKLKIVIQSNKNPSLIKRFFGDVKIINSDNLIKWYHDNNGNIDMPKVTRYYRNYKTKSSKWFKKFTKDKNYDFFISDMSPEAFELGRKLKIPTFGICHFTWDWFFNQIFPPVISQKILDSWNQYQKKATKIFFPPLTPSGCLRLYPNNKKVDFIINTKIKNPDSNPIKNKMGKKKFKILIIDSGDGVTTKAFKQIIKNNLNHKNIKLICQEKMGKFKNTLTIKENYFIGPLIRHVDLVIGRPGYNTVTEVLKNKKPAVFLSNKFNPEMDWNISQLYLNTLSGYTSTSQLSKNFSEIVEYMKKIKFKEYKKNITKQKYIFSGQRQIANTIKKIINEKK